MGMLQRDVCEQEKMRGWSRLLKYWCLVFNPVCAIDAVSFCFTNPLCINSCFVTKESFFHSPCFNYKSILRNPCFLPPFTITPIHFTLLSPASPGTRLPPGARFSKVPVVTFRVRKAILWFAVATGNNFANDNMAMKLLVNKAELTGLWVRNCSTVQLVSISRVAFRPEKLFRETGAWFFFCLAVEMAGHNSSDSCSKSNVEKKKNKLSKWLKDSWRYFHLLSMFFLLVDTIDTSHQEYCPKLPSGRVSHRMRIWLSIRR